MAFAMVDPPSYLDTLEKWEQHLDEMRSLPDDVSNKQRLIRYAEETIAMKRRDPGRA
jgi:hypothetical protein